MFLRVLFLCLVMVSVSVKAVTVKSIVAGDWENPACWSNHQVPINPDTILVSHYMLINQDLTINSPTVLFIDAAGTICGDYLMETLCGASFVNYGHIYLNHLKTRSGINHNIIQCKTYMTLLACAGYGNYHGALTVWPPVFCKTVDTNWEGGTATGIEELQHAGISVYPNPVSGQALTLVSPRQNSFKLTDLMGNLIYKGAFSDVTTIDASSLSTGIYVLDLEVNGKRYLQKIVKTD